MKRNWLGLVTMAALAMATTVVLPSTAAAQGLPKTFTYQGQLTALGTPANGPYDFQFSLWTEVGPGGTQIGSTSQLEDVTVSNGIFKVELDFSSTIQFNLGQAMWLQIEARPGAETGVYTTLSPRQLITPAPLALALVPGSNIWVTQDNVDSLGINNSGANSRSLNITTSGNNSVGISVTASSNSSSAIQASAQGNVPNSVGVYGRSDSSTGSGIEGWSTADSGSPYGVYGRAAAPNGKGVYGLATASTGNSSGVYGEAQSQDGAGVFGRSIPLTGSGAGVEGESNSTDGYAIYGLNNSTTAPSIGIYGKTSAAAGTAIRGEASLASGASIGVHGRTASETAGAAGVFGEATAASGQAYGVYGRSTSGSGVAVYGLGQGAGGKGVQGRSISAAGYAGHFENTGNGVAVYAKGEGSGRVQAALRVDNDETDEGMAAYITNNSNYASAHFFNGGIGEVLYLQNGGVDGLGTLGGDFIKAVNEAESDPQFRVLTSGEVRSDVGFNTPAADFAEMLPAANDGAGLEPGDVLVIGPDGHLTRSEQPHQTNVAGVYSTKPGFVGGMPMEGATVGTIPLAVIGIVPVKVSAENGAIQPGDLLSASAIPGHAMRAGSGAPQGSVIGKALNPLAEGSGVISMLVTLH